MITSGVRRLGELMPLGLELARTRAPVPGMPRGEDLVNLERHCRSAGGLPGLVADSVAAYAPATSHALRPATTAGGRIAHHATEPGAPSRSVGDPDRRVALDLSLVGPPLALGLASRSDKVRYARHLLRQRAADAARNAASTHAASDALAVAAVLAEHGAPVRLAVVGDATDLAITVEAAADATPAAVVAALLGSGLVHGHLGAQQWPTRPLWATTHWECVRAVSADVQRLLVHVVRTASGHGDASTLVHLACALGVPRPSAAANLPRFVDLLAPVAPELADHLGSSVRTEAPGPSAEPAGGPHRAADALGLLYGICDLLAVRPAI